MATKKKSHIFDKVLVLNSGWYGIGVCTVKKALEDMNSCKTPKKALKIEYFKDPNTGEYDFTQPIEITPLDWDYWVQISPREYDEDAIHTPRLSIRIPTAIICPKFSKMPRKTFRPIKRHIYNRYEGKCAYTGEFLSYKEATLDHIMPKSRGGGNDWNNLVLSKPDVNRKKADRTPDEAGLKLLYKPSEPNAVIAAISIPLLHRDWILFPPLSEKEKL